jgi:hypothetical protein
MLSSLIAPGFYLSTQEIIPPAAGEESGILGRLAPSDGSRHDADILSVGDKAVSTVE